MHWLPTIIFLLSSTFLVYVLIGYPVLLNFLARRFKNPVHKADYEPTVAVVIPVRNGQAYIRRKLDSMLQLDYPAGKMEILVISDGSTDQTDEIAEEYATRGVQLLRVPHGGKPAALNAGIPRTKNEILLLTDIRQVLEPHSLRRLLAPFADRSVGVVSGELLIRQGDNQAGEHIAAYRNFENWLRNKLSDLDSMLGATGSFYSMRRELAVPMPPDTLLDDVFLPLGAFFQGYRLIIEPLARAYDDPTSLGTEFRRKVRTLAGNYQIMQRMPAVLTFRNRMWIHFVSIKLGRLLLPFALLAIAATSFFLPQRWMVYTALGLQGFVYGLALFDFFDGWLPEEFILKKLSSAARTFVVMMVAAFCALSIFFVSPRKLWTPTKTRTSGVA